MKMDLDKSLVGRQRDNANARAANAEAMDQIAQDRRDVSIKRKC